MAAFFFRRSIARCRTTLVLLVAGVATLFATDPAPMTDYPANHAPGVFRFAIVGDRAGGVRAEVFADAVNKLQSLQPEFVMSVGDLIDGYTTDPVVVEKEWQEFENTVNRLGVPFYHVAGNHDISNPVLLEAWKQRHGSPWYSFIYQHVLFLCLHTEDRPFGGLGAEQIAWAKQTLAEHQDVKWTLLFFHRPLWLEKNQAGYEQVAAALHGRPYTVFSGHLHHYVEAERDGMRHYALATTGGGSPLRGADFGEFDHLTWVTMKPDGPVVANLALSGIVPDDIVAEKIYPEINALREGSWLHFDPVVNDSAEFRSLTLPLHLGNPTAQPLHVHGQFKPVAGMHFEPAAIDQIVAPQQTAQVAIKLVADEKPVSIHAVNEAVVRLGLTAGYEIRGRTLELPAHQHLQLDWIHRAAHARTPIQLDGDLTEWPADTFTAVEHPMSIDEEWDWSGPEDGRFRFSVQEYGGKIYVAVETTDDHVITSSDPGQLQDKLLLQIKTSSGTTKLEGIAGTARSDAVVRATATGLVGEFMFALPSGEKSFHLNIGWQDHDRPENTKPSVLWWRNREIPALGLFTLAP